MKNRERNLNYKSMWNLDESGKIIGMNIDNIPKEKYICHRCNKNHITIGHKNLCDQCLIDKDNKGVYLLMHLITRDKYVGKSQTLAARVINHTFNRSDSIQIAATNAAHHCLWLIVQLSTIPEDEGWWIEELNPSLNKQSVPNNGIVDLTTALDSKVALRKLSYLLDDLNLALKKIKEKENK